MATTQSIKQDGRSFRYNKNTTERHIEKMGHKTLTLIKYTDKSKTASPYWQGKCFVGGRVLQKTTKEEDLKKAIKVGVAWMADLMSNEKKGIPIVNTPSRFTEVADKVLKKIKQMSGTSHHKDYYKNQYLLYKNYLYPYFKNVLVENITPPKLHEWMEQRKLDGMISVDVEGTNKPLTQGALKREVMLMRMILSYASSTGLIKRIPDIPKEPMRGLKDKKKKPKSGGRIGFNSSEYRKLLLTSRRQIKEAEKNMDENTTSFKPGNWTRTYLTRLSLHYFIILMASCGARTEEIVGSKGITHGRITVVEKAPSGKKLPTNERYLMLAVKGKTGLRDVYCRNSGYHAYKKFVERCCPNHKKHDLLFPHSPIVGLKNLLNKADLRYDRWNRKRDSKSLRHYFIACQLARGDDVWSVSVQCGTSPEVIQKHYVPEAKVQQYKEVILNPKKVELL